jgi:hypothetical protein
VICDKHGDCGFLKPFAALVFLLPKRVQIRFGSSLAAAEKIEIAENPIENIKGPGPRPSSQEARRVPTGSTILSKFVCMVYAVYICIHKLIHI